jgi:hypothetical protein
MCAVEMKLASQEWKVVLNLFLLQDGKEAKCVPEEYEEGLAAMAAKQYIKPWNGS